MRKCICATAVTVALFGAVLTPAMAVVPVSASAAPAAAPADIGTRLLGKTVFLDPGHQGGGSAAQMGRLVDNGRGGLKPCETSGMTALGGMPEHTITWKVAELVRASLQNLGARVVMSRPDDVSWAGCITDRARAANVSGAAVAISIHADGAPAPDRGFHFIVPQLPVPNQLVNSVQAGQGMAATRAVRDAYLRFGFQLANYVGAVGGLQARSDIAGPALTTVPDVFVEMGNGANRDDAAALTTPQGQLRHALAITTGLVAYLLGAAPGGSVAQQLPPAQANTMPTVPAVPAASTGPTVPAGLSLPAGPSLPAGSTVSTGGPMSAVPDDLAASPAPSTVPATRAGQVDQYTDLGTSPTPSGLANGGGYAAMIQNALPKLTNAFAPLITSLLGPLLGVLGVQGPALAGAAGSLASGLLAALAAP